MNKRTRVVRSHPWTTREINTVYRWASRGLSNREISAKLQGRSAAAVSYIIRKTHDYWGTPGRYDC